MIVFRNKTFGNLDDRFEGKKGEIKRSKFRKLDSYSKTGPWKVKFSENARDEMAEFSKEKRESIQKISDEVSIHPYEGNYGQHPLWEFFDINNECVVWSAEIDNKNRFNYLIFKQQNYILVTNLIGHKVIDMTYGNR